MAPVTLVLVLLGLEPVVLFSWTIGIMVAMQITHTIPTSWQLYQEYHGCANGILQFHCQEIRYTPYCHEKNGSWIFNRFYYSSSCFRCICIFLAPLGDMITPYIGLIFTIGAVIIAYMSNAKWAAVIS